MKELFNNVEKSLQELENEVAKKQKEFWKKFKDLEKKKIDVDEELLKDFLEEYWFINPKSETEYEIIVPRWLNFSVGWLDRTTKGYNVFVVNKYTQWLGQIPEFLRKELQIQEPEKIKFDGENLIFEEGKEKYIKENFDKFLTSINKNSARVKRGNEFDLIASIIDSGSLPFIPKPVDEKDIREQKSSIKFEGKYGFQKEAWGTFLKYGACGIYWMTGAGKDIFSTYVLDRIKVNKLPNLYVAPNLTILEQMKKEYFPKYAPHLLKEIEENKLILATYQAYDKLKNKEYGIIIFAENHMLPADTFSRLATLKCKYRLGQCLHPKTKVILENGNVIQIRYLIEKLKKGEKINVLSYNLKKKIIESKPIIDFFEKDMDDLFRISVKTKKGIRKITCSGEHKFFINGRYVPASELKEGDEFMLLNQPHSTLNNPAKKIGHKISEKLKGRKLKESTKEEIRKSNKKKWLDENYRKSQELKHLGQKSYLKGKTFDEYFGKEKSKIIREKISINSKESTNKHFDLVLKLQKDFEKKGYRFIPLVKVTPDAILIKGNKVIAVELENKTPNYYKYKLTGKFYDDIIWIVKKIRFRRKK